MKKNPLIIGLISLLILLWAYSPAGAEGKLLFQDDFEGEPDPLWELEQGWQIIQEGGNTLLQGQGHSWARINQTFPEDFQLTLRIKVLSGRIHLVTQLNDQGRYYIGLGGELTSLNKQYWPDTFLNDLQIGGGPLPPAVWHTVELISLGDQIQVSVDGEKLWEYHDEDKLGPGGIALETLEGSRVQVDNLAISALGETPNQAEKGAEKEDHTGS